MFFNLFKWYHISLYICGFEVRDSCEFMLNLSFASLFNDFKKEANEITCEFDMLAQMGKKMGCNL